MISLEDLEKYEGQCLNSKSALQKGLMDFRVFYAGDFNSDELRSEILKIHKLIVEYANCFENLVEKGVSSRFFEKHPNVALSKAEWAYEILELVVYYKIEFSLKCKQNGVSKKIIQFSKTSFSKMQRLVADCLDKESVNLIVKKFEKQKISTYGFKNKYRLPTSLFYSITFKIFLCCGIFLMAVAFVVFCNVCKIDKDILKFGSIFLFSLLTSLIAVSIGDQIKYKIEVPYIKLENEGGKIVGLWILFFLLYLVLFSIFFNK